jgi:hypothetical protein
MGRSGSDSVGAVLSHPLDRPWLLRLILAIDWETFFKIASPIALAGLIITVLAQIVAKLNRVRDRLKEHQPSLVVNYSLLQGPPYSVDVRITNSGPGPALNTTVRIDGLPGSVVHTPLAKNQSFNAIFNVPNDAPLRSQPLDGAGLLIQCEDELGFPHVLKAPIRDHNLRADGLYNFGFDLQQVVERRPSISGMKLWRIRKTVDY